jgi:aminodeoxyfutalosine synthase
MSVLQRIHTPSRPSGSAPHAHVDPRLEPIRDKIDRGERLTLDDGEVLFSTPDLWSVLAMADSVRRLLHGDATYYNINRHLNYSNVCALSCKFCEFYRKKDDPGAYTRDMAYVRDEVRKAVEAGATEMHSVGGLHPYLPFSYYTDLVSTIRDEAHRLGSELHVKAFTAVEIVHLARIAKVYKGANEPGEAGRHARREAIRWVLTQLKDAGLGSLPGGGAEVFDDRVHDEAYKGKIRSDVWLDVHRVAHELGLNTNATLLYGHIESRRDRLVHMDMLRRAQDEALARMGYAGETNRRSSKETELADHGVGHLGYTGLEGGDAPVITLTRPGTPLPEHLAFGHAAPTPSLRNFVSPSLAPPPGYYQTIIPLPFFPDGSALEHLPGPSGLENLRTIAIARLMLDNIPHVKAFWIMQTLPMAQLMLQAGADDLDGTVVWYDITKVGHGGRSEAATKRGSEEALKDQVAAAASESNTATHQQVTVWTLETAIREAGFKPIERDTLYRRVNRKGRAWSVESRV